MIRDVFPRRPAPRGRITFVERTAFAPAGPRRARPVARAAARARRWWRRHWWPARIRDLEAMLEHERDWE